ncbi:hypothetical protein BDW68DRAFT_170943, partial [Aspergillus falconensis]
MACRIKRRSTPCSSQKSLLYTGIRTSGVCRPSVSTSAPSCSTNLASPSIRFISASPDLADSTRGSLGLAKIEVDRPMLLRGP